MHFDKVSIHPSIHLHNNDKQIPFLEFVFPLVLKPINDLKTTIHCNDKSKVKLFKLISSDDDKN